MTDVIHETEVSDKENDSIHKISDTKMEKEVKVSKKRKRKHELNSTTDETTTEPDKKLKTETIENVSSQNNLQNDSEINPDDLDHGDHHEIEVSKPESDQFSGKYMRNALNSSGGLSTLQKFITICKQDSKRDLATEYLQAGGSILEILRLLEPSDKKNVHNAVTVFKTMHIILLKILAKFPQNYSSSEEACRHLINNHFGSIHLLLSSQSTMKSRKVALKLLAAMVSLGGTLPRELLNNLSFHPQFIETVVSHTKPTDHESVRTCFIHFILAFLIEGNSSDLRTLLDKKGVLSSIFSGLIYDYSNLVQLVLSTVKKYILENSAISKTFKLHVFSTPVVKDIVNLYNWKGPENWPGLKKQIKSSTIVNPEEKEITVISVHDFLITLLTSNRYGVVFHDRSLGTESGSKHNQLINTVLQNLDKPWEYNKPSDLVLKILTACPDLIKSQLLYMESFLTPEDSEKWANLMQFVVKIIENIDEESCMVLSASNMTTLQLSNAIVNLVIPQIVMKQAVIPSFSHESILIHHQITLLLLTMMKKLINFMKKIDKFRVDTFENNSFRNLIQKSILKYMPNFAQLVIFWKQSLTSDNVKDDESNQVSYVNLKDYLITLLDLLEIYYEICPELTENSISSPGWEPHVLFTRLAYLINVTDEESTLIKVKSLKILVRSTRVFCLPNEKFFEKAISFLAQNITSENTTIKTEVRKIFNLLLSKIEIFEEFNHEIDIWIDGLSNVKDAEDREKTAWWLSTLLTDVFKNNKTVESSIHKIKKITEREIVDENRYKKLFNDLSERDIDDVKSLFSMLPVISLSVVTCEAVEFFCQCTEIPVQNLIKFYISTVFTHILHCQISTSAFIILTEKLNVPVQQYLLSWSEKNSPIVLPKKCCSNKIFSMISKFLLVPNNHSKIFVEKSQLFIQLDEDEVNFTLTNFEIMALIRMITFYLTQSLQKLDTECQNIEVYKSSLLSVLQLAYEVDKDSDNLIMDCISWIFKHPVILQNFQGLYKGSKDSSFTELILDICNFIFGLKKQHLLSTLILPYQDKFIGQFKDAVKKSSTSNKNKFKVHEEFIEYLQLDIEKIEQLLNLIMTLPKDKFVSLDKSKFSVWGIITPKLIEQFYKKQETCGLSLLVIISDNLIKKLFNYLIELKKTLENETDQWESNLYNYLMKFPHAISTVDERIFTALMSSNISPNTRKIIILLTERNPKFTFSFVKYAKDNNDIFKQTDLVFSVLSNNLGYKWDEEFLIKMFNQYKEEITNFLTEPGTYDLIWLKENIKAVSHLIEHIFDLETCNRISRSILLNGNKLDSVKEEHVKLYFQIFKKITGKESNGLKDFIQVLILITVSVLKKDSKNLTKLNFLCNMFIESIDILKKNGDIIFEELNKNKFWPQFTRINLKSGLKIPIKDETQNFLLKALVATCDITYRENGNEEYVKTIFEMTTSHSEFINIMLCKNEGVKSLLIELLWTLIRKNNLVMSVSQIPLYLASYNGTLIKSDRLLLKILQYYESNGINLDDYRPYLWGSAAASHYSVKGEVDTALWRQPSTSQVLDLLIPENVRNTIKYFPIKRNYEIDLIDKINIEDQIYDPAFYLPLFTNLLAENNVVACHKVIHSGALALAIIACSSIDEQMRLSAYTVISRFYFHLEATSSKEKLLWINFIDVIRNGIINTELPLKNIQLNGFVATFLARTCLNMTQPLNPLYLPLTSFLMAKPALDINTIPELLQLYHSSEVEYQAHRYWILEVIRDGIKVDSDINVAMKCVIYKMLFDFYTSKLADKKSKGLILEIVISSTKLSKPCLILLNGHALLPWLIIVTHELCTDDVDSVRHLINIANNILNAIRETKSKEAHYYIILMKVMINLKSSFSKALSEDDFKNYIFILTELMMNDSLCKAFTINDIQDILNFSKRYLQDVSDYQLMLQYGCKFVKKVQSKFNTKLSLRETLYTFIMKWLRFVKTLK